MLNLNNILVILLSFVITLPLYSHWLGSTITYIFYLLAIAGSSYLFYKNKSKFYFLDLPFFLFVILSLFSVIYTVSFDYMTELLYIPLLVFIYIFGKSLIYDNNIKIFFSGLTLFFFLFSIYLVFQLIENSFNYGLYYHFSNASNKVEYLTMSMYAGTVAIYAYFMVETYILRLFLLFYTYILIFISGARFSIIFFVALTLILFLNNKNIVKNIFIILFGLITLFLINNYFKIIDTQFIFDFFNFSINRLNHFDMHNNSLIGRFQAIQDSFLALNQHPFFGYGLHSSPHIIHFIYPHNLLLEAWLDLGILGLLSILTMIILTLIVLWKIRKNRYFTFFTTLYIYILLAHLKSFSIFHATLFFLITSTIFAYYQRKKH